MRLAEKVEEGASIEFCQRLEFDHIDPSFSGLHPRDPGLRPAEGFGYLGLFQPFGFPGVDQSFDKPSVGCGMHVPHTVNGAIATALCKVRIKTDTAMGYHLSP